MTTKAHTAAVAYWQHRLQMFERQLAANYERNIYTDRRHNMDHYRQRQHMRNQIRRAKNKLIQLQGE